MTLIAVRDYGNNHTFLIADIIVSSANPPADEPSLPTRANFGQSGDTPYHIADTVQKVTLISPALAIAWAGDRITSHVAIKALYDRFNGRPASSNAVRDCLEEVEREMTPGKDCELLGLIWRKGKAQAFHWSRFVPGKLKRVTNDAVGSGEQHFIRAVSEKVRHGKAHSDPLLEVMEDTVRIIGEEVETGANLLKYYGGAFQIVWADDKGLQPMTSITTFFLAAFLLGNNVVVQPRRIIKSEWNQRELEFLVAKNDPNTATRESFQVHPFINANPRRSVPTIASFSSQLYAMHVQIQQSAPNPVFNIGTNAPLVCCWKASGPLQYCEIVENRLPDKSPPIQVVLTDAGRSLIESHMALRETQLTEFIERANRSTLDHLPPGTQIQASAFVGPLPIGWAADSGNPAQTESGSSS